MKKRCKGFTLVELLAVIIVLAIIFLIAVPLVINIVTNTKKEAFRKSVVSASKSLEYYVVDKKLIDVPSNGVLVTDLALSGDLKDGKFVKDSDDVIAQYITDGVYCAYGPVNDLLIENDCHSLDSTEPVLDDSKLILSSTSNSVSLSLLEGFAIDPETGIKEYLIELYDGTILVDKIKTNKIGSFKFDKLPKQKSYTINITVKNGVDLTSNSGDKNISTKDISVPTYLVIPSGWAQEKKVEILYQTGLTNEYSINGGIEFELYKNPIIFDENGTVIARINDGVNYVTASSQTITGIDRTAPILSDFTYSVTSNSIKVIASGEDSESGIYGYRFSIDGGQTWTDVKTSNIYTFTNLSSGTYNVKVRVINGTYLNSGENEMSYLDSDIQKVATTIINEPTYLVTPSGWAQSKFVTISYDAGYTNEYSIDGGNTFIAYTKAVELTSNGSIIARVNDGKNYVTASSQTVTGIDGSAPTKSTFSYTVTSKSITVVATGEDAESNVYGYRFSSDGGQTWTGIQTSNSYTFNNLTSGTYNIKVRVINGTYPNSGENTKSYLDSAAQSVKTTTIAVPTYAVSPSGWAQSKTVTITYPQGYTNEYSIDGGKSWKSYTGAIPFTANGSVIARVNDGKNYVTASSQTVAYIDTRKPSTPTIGLRMNSASGSSYTSGAWTNANIYHIVSSTDDYSGIAYYQYSHNGSTGWSNDISTLGWPYSYNSDRTQLTYAITFAGNWNFYVRAVDNAGNVSPNSAMFTLKIDKSAPNTPTSVIRYGSSSGSVRTNSNSWTNQALWWGSYSATDNGSSGINHYEYSTNCSGSKSGDLSTGGYTYGSGTNYTFCIRSVDNAGNASGWSGAHYFKVDGVGPTCGTVSGASTSWTNGNRTISVACSDTGGSGCTSSSYSQTYSSTTQTSTITIRDNAGNTKNCSVNVYVDKTPPVVSLSGVTPSTYANWTSECYPNRYITMSATDVGSGIDINSSGYTRLYYSYLNYSKQNLSGYPNQGHKVDSTYKIVNGEYRITSLYQGSGAYIRTGVYDKAGNYSTIDVSLKTYCDSDARFTYGVVTK